MNGLGDALVDVLIRSMNRPRLRVMAEWIAEAARPPPGVRLVTENGAEFSGIVLVDRNEPVMMLAVNVRRLRPGAPNTDLRRRGDGPLWRPPDDDDLFP